MCHTVFSTCFSVHGGELFERIVAEEYLMEDDAVDYVRQILEALTFMHERHIVHLDLKVTNTFLSVLFDYTRIKGKELGLFQVSPSANSIYTLCEYSYFYLGQRMNMSPCPVDSLPLPNLSMYFMNSKYITYDHFVIFKGKR